MDLSEKKVVLITGGTGTIGSALVPLLVEKGFGVRLFALQGDRAAESFDGDSVEVCYGDIANQESVKDICRGVSTVIHLAAVVLSDDESLFDSVNVMGTRYLLEDAQKHNVHHFIHISSASVVYRRLTPYSRSKRIAEKYVKNSGVPWTIIRPTLVYGEVGGMEFDLFLQYLLKWPVVPFIGNGGALKRPVYIDDLVYGLKKTALLEKGTGRIYNFSGGSDISMIDFARLCLTLSGREDKIIIHIPVILCRLLALVMKRIMKNPLLKWNMIAGVIQDANLDPNKAILDLEYNPYPVEQKLKDCFPRK